VEWQQSDMHKRFDTRGTKLRSNLATFLQNDPYLISISFFDHGSSVDFTYKEPIDVHPRVPIDCKYCFRGLSGRRTQIFFLSPNLHIHFLLS
jgi:hypothetical protein